jgi:hypothetical protein
MHPPSGKHNTVIPVGGFDAMAARIESAALFVAANAPSRSPVPLVTVAIPAIRITAMVAMTLPVRCMSPSFELGVERRE